ncbi:Transmembrane protein [Trichinella spiralis]|uniref:Transmembrane protein n=1 Tax=Trichinella spiralis TaxID=6334 RepID=A0ABR3KDC7_TRISP
MNNNSSSVEQVVLYSMVNLKCLQRYDDVWIMFGHSAWAFAAMFAFSVLTERHVGVTLIFQVSLSTLLYIDSRLSNTQLSHQQHFKQHNYGRNFGFFVENAFSAPVRKLILILRPLWEKIRNAKLIITFSVPFHQLAPPSFT